VLRRLFEVLRIRNFLFLSLSGTVSQLGDRLTHMLLITLIAVSQPGKMFAYSQASLAFTIPVILLSPIAGVLVDHWNRRKIMAYTHFIQSAVLITTPFLIRWAGSFYPFWIVVFVFFGLDILNNTAKPSLLPEVVASRKLLTANALDQFFTRFATVLGMVVGGYLIRWVGWRYGFFIDAATHLCAGLMVLGIVLKTTKKPETRLKLEKSSTAGLFSASFRIFFHDVKEVLVLVGKDRLVLFVMTSIWVAYFIAGVSYTILLFLVQQGLGMGTAGVGLFAGILAVGMIFGSVVLGMLKPTINKPLIVVTGIASYGLLFLFGPFLIRMWFLVVIALGGGVIYSWITIAQNTILQEAVPPQIRGRIFSTKEFFTNVAFIVTTFTTGLLGDLTSVRVVLIIIGLCLLVLSTLGYLLVKRINIAPKTSPS